MSEKDKRLVYGILHELLMMNYDELNKTFGSMTINEMQNLYARLYYEDYCNQHGISYDGMTDDEKVEAAFAIEGYR